MNNTTKMLTQHDMAVEYSRIFNKFLLYLSFPRWDDSLGDNSIEEIIKAAPYLVDFDNFEQALIDESCYIICDSEDECIKLFNQTIGDDGPTDSNKYNGQARVYAMIVSPNYGIVNENT